MTMNGAHLTSFGIEFQTDKAIENERSPSVAILSAGQLRWSMVWAGPSYAGVWFVSSAACQWHMMVQHCCDSSSTNKLFCRCFLLWQEANEVILNVCLCCDTLEYVTLIELHSIRCKWDFTPWVETNRSELQKSILDKTKADTSVAVAVLVRNLWIDAKRRRSK